jgi:hypothetical protein
MILPGCRSLCSALSADENNLAKLRAIQEEVVRGRLLRDQSYMKVVNGELISVLHGSIKNSDTDLQAAAEVLRVIGRKGPFILQDFQLFDSISRILLETDDEHVLRVLLPPFLMACKYLRYYNATLMSHAGEYVINNLDRFSQGELSRMVHAFAELNHHAPHLVAEVERFLLTKRLMYVNPYLLWNLAWYGMIFQEYPKEVLPLILTDDYITGERVTGGPWWHGSVGLACDFAC